MVMPKTETIAAFDASNQTRQSTKVFATVTSVKPSGDDMNC